MFVSVATPVVLYRYNLVAKYFLFISYIAFLPAREEANQKVYLCFGWFMRMDVHPNLTIIMFIKERFKNL